MTDKNVDAIAHLLNRKPEEVKVAVEADTGLAEMIEAFNKDFKVVNDHEFKILKNEDFDAFKKNHKDEVLRSLKVNDLPDHIRSDKTLIAWKLEKIENELKEKYQFDGDFHGVEDLIEKIITNKTKDNDNEQSQKEVQALKDQIDKLTKDYDKKVKDAHRQTDSFIIEKTVDGAVRGLNLDYDEDAMPKQTKLLLDSFNSTYEVKRDGDKILVSERGREDFIKDAKLDPVPVSEVVAQHAKDYGFKMKSPEQGGQGGSSSKGDGKSAYYGMSHNDLVAKMREDGITPASEEGDKIYQAWREANPDTVR